MFYAALTATAFMFFFGMGHSNLKKNIRIILLMIGWAFFGLHSYIIGQIAMQLLYGRFVVIFYFYRLSW